MTYLLVSAEHVQVSNNFIRGGARVLQEISNAVPCTPFECVDAVTGIMPYMQLQRQFKHLRIPPDCSGVITTTGFPPPPCGVPRYTYAHTAFVTRFATRWWRPGLFRRRLGRLQVRDRDGCKYLCNADWVRDALERHGCDAVTVNPPCRIPADVDVKGPRKPRVISVGAIVYQKGHDLVMETCDSVGVKCEIYGYGTAYDSRMHTSVSDDVIDSAARSAKVVMSGAFMEDFGIAVVEAIARGCVPVVPDRYGFKETVPYAELRYETKQQAARLVREAIDGTYDDLIPKLMRHVQQYSTEQFIRAMRHHLSGNRSQDI